MAGLKEALVAQYGEQWHRAKPVLNRFVVDDRNPGDLDAKGNLYGGRCGVTVEVVDDEHVRVALSDIPRGPSVDAWLTATGERISEQHYSSMGKQSQLAFAVTPTTLHQILSLATALRAIVAPGAARYEVASYKYTCPRTADSLERLNGMLRQAWATAMAAT